MKTVVNLTITTQEGEVLEETNIWLMKKDQRMEDGPITVAQKIIDYLGNRFEMEEVK